jgi:cell division transport system permease protein
MVNFFSPTLNDIPLDNDDNSRYVCWVIGLMVFLLGMIYLGTLTISSADQWGFRNNERVTIEIPMEGVANPENLIQDVISTMQRLPLVNQINLLDSQAVLKSIQPWLNGTGIPDTVNLPCLIDVDFQSGAIVDYDDILNHLRPLSHSITLENHEPWQEKLKTMRLRLEIIAILFMILISLTVMITVTLITRSSLKTHIPTVDALRLMGATNSYIAGKFQNRAFILALKGGLWGAILALPIFLTINWVGDYWGNVSVTKFFPSFLLVSGILAIPLIVSGLSLVGARFCVVKMLRHLN